ncbi:MAG: hypothetical protein LBK27_08480 [Treponema sp.]|jgi:hypothetical protein|nr:hypothetical protein [Treponema sp.]
MFTELAKNRKTDSPSRRDRGTTQCTGSYRYLLELDLEAIKALHMKAYGYDYDHALDNREPA